MKVTRCSITMEIEVCAPDIENDLDEHEARKFANSYVEDHHSALGERWLFSHCELLNYDKVRVVYER